MSKHLFCNLPVAPFLAVAMVSSAGAVDLLDEDFSANDGGFVQEATGNTPIPSIYNSGSGTWSMEGDDSGPATNTITSPSIAVPTTHEIQVSFDHRYSIEGGNWDGGGLQISIDGGAFTNVPSSAFKQNGYTNPLPLIGNHVLIGLDGFSMDSAGYGDGTFITSIAKVGVVDAGSSIQVRFVGAFDEGAKGPGNPNWEIDSVKVETLTDADNDGMPDAYEDANSLDKNVDDSAGDLDSDNSTNLEEYIRRTDPNNDDTDDDGILDGNEDGGGTFVSATETGTDPLVADTDEDGLEDGLEDGGGTFVSATQTGTDPNKADTDGDKQKDGFEVNNSTDPNDPNSKSAVATVTLIDGLLGGDLTDPEDDGIDGETIFADGDNPQTAGENFNWISITANAEEYFGNFGGSEGSFDVFDNQIGGGQNKLCCGGEPVEITVQFEVAVSLTHITLTSSNDTPGRDPLDFEIQGSNDGIVFETIYARADDESIWGGTRDLTAQIDLPSPSDAYEYIRYAVTRTGIGVHAISEIEYFGETGPVAPLQISSIDVNSATNEVTLTWNSRDNRTYSVFTSSDMTGFSEDVDDSIPSGGDLTSFTFALSNPIDVRRFFRVVENE
ncbi:MAG: hypothetical protein OSA93_10345 [Akkermansiaceae bacterium]|jgi:hypothetical protein|nr:hypothetical protein [Akkermansiaceae bacterium]